MEYMGKELFAASGIKIQQGILIEDPNDLEEAIGILGLPVVLKAQVQIGKRGKAGGICFAETKQEAAYEADRILGMSINGEITRKILVAQKIDIVKELYLSITLDRKNKLPLVVFSKEGGIDIEKTAIETPSSIAGSHIDPFIGVSGHITRYLLSKTGADFSLFKKLDEVIRNLYKVFIENECLLTEINPLALTQNNELIAIDSKVTVDDNSISRHKKLLSYRNEFDIDDRIKKASAQGFLYIPCEETGDIVIMSNGSGMLMSCIDLISKEGYQVKAAFDLGGGATCERIKEAVKMILSEPHVSVLFISIFGGITRCDEVARGVKAAREEMLSEQLIIVRIEGTNKEEGVRILNSIEGSVVSAGSIQEGIKELVRRRPIK